MLIVLNWLVFCYLVFMLCKDFLRLSLKNTATGISYVSCLINNWVSVTDTKYSWLVIGSNNGCHVYLKKAFTFSTAKEIRHTITSSAAEIMRIELQKWLERERLWDAKKVLSTLWCNHQWKLLYWACWLATALFFSLSISHLNQILLVDFIFHMFLCTITSVHRSI